MHVLLFQSRATSSPAHLFATRERRKRGKKVFFLNCSGDEGETRGKFTEPLIIVYLLTFLSDLFILISIVPQDKVNSKFISCNEEQLLSGDYKFCIRFRTWNFQRLLLICYTNSLPINIHYRDESLRKFFWLSHEKHPVNSQARQRI